VRVRLRNGSGACRWFWWLAVCRLSGNRARGRRRRATKQSVPEGRKDLAQAVEKTARVVRRCLHSRGRHVALVTRTLGTHPFPVSFFNGVVDFRKIPVCKNHSVRLPVALELVKGLHEVLEAFPGHGVIGHVPVHLAKLAPRLLESGEIFVVDERHGEGSPG
jgi:hypothetical protein